jgi:hypothetical protein
MNARHPCRRVGGVWLLAAVMLTTVAPQGRAWGKLGHEAIGTLAAELLHEKARLRIKKILGPDDLAGASTWLGDLRSAEKGKGGLANNAEAAAFNKKFSDNHKWHYVNLPLNTAAYSRGSRFAEDNDVVHMIEAAIGVLEGMSRKFTPAQAVRIIAHLAGDLHQPLHVGTGFFDLRDPNAPKLVIDPANAGNHAEDLGGNKIQVGRMAFETLQAYWDTQLVKAAGGTGSAVKLAAKMRGALQPARWTTRGDHRVWAEAWATDAVHEAEFAYCGLIFKGAKLTERKSLTFTKEELPPEYEKIQKQRALAQLAKAAFHLAALFNAINWKVP